MERPIWFKAKKKGWGWVPATWQGWVATGIYAGAVTFWVYYVISAPSPDTHPLAIAAPVLLLTAGYLALCFVRGEKPRPRFGRKQP